jgi:hypothetical protein
MGADTEVPENRVLIVCRRHFTENVANLASFLGNFPKHIRGS